ncbi:MAG: molybdate ABC transporter substrate-binding protein [Myxococcales bacterium]|nr:molybdate ABC transporter substrate-binding protein [Myxococcales bacterium]
MRVFVATVAASALALGLWGCRAAPARAPVVVFAASSLTDAFGALEADFEAAHPSLDLQLSFAGSQVLRLQIEQGARADLFASADLEHVQALHAAGLAGMARIFARNGLALIVPEANPAGLRRFEDLPRARRIVLGAPQVPAGRYADEALRKVGLPFAEQVQARVVSRETNVRLVRAKVALGEADAALVYRTDTHGVAGITVLPLPDAVQVAAAYPIATVAAGPNPAGASAFLAFLQGAQAQRVLQAHGFLAP